VAPCSYFPALEDEMERKTRVALSAGCMIELRGPVFGTMSESAGT